MSSAECTNGEFGYVLLDLAKPQIAWLACVGVIYSVDIADANPGNISWWLVSTLSRATAPRFEREASFERIRRAEFRDCPSRLNSVFSFPDIQSAGQGRQFLRETEMVAIEPASPNYTAFRFDMNWIDYPNEVESVARRYWRRESSNEPVYEQLLSGEFNICGTTVRKRAYETIRGAFPESLALLELARLAPLVGSKLGHVAPWAKIEGNELVFTYIVRHDDNEGPEILRRAIERAQHDPSFPINHQDLEPLRNPDLPFCVPDFRPFEVRVPAGAVAQFSQLVAERAH